MDRLILLRHGSAEAESPTERDIDRNLTENGRRDAALVARALAEANLTPDLVLVSPAARTVQTWQAVQPFLLAARCQVEPSLYAIASTEILALAKSQGGGARAVMVIGHNPALGQLAAWLANEGPAPAEVRLRLAQGFPTAAAAVIDFKPRGFAFYSPQALGPQPVGDGA